MKFCSPSQFSCRNIQETDSCCTGCLLWFDSVCRSASAWLPYSDCSRVLKRLHDRPLPSHKTAVWRHRPERYANPGLKRRHVNYMHVDNMSIYLSIYIHPSIQLNISLSTIYLSTFIHPPNYLSIYLSTFFHPSNYRSIYLSIYLSIYSIYLSTFIHPSNYLSIYIYPSTQLSIYLSTFIHPSIHPIIYLHSPIHPIIYLSTIYLSIYIYPSTQLSIYLSIYLHPSIHRTNYLSIYLHSSIHPIIDLSTIYLSIYIHPSNYLSIYPSIYLLSIYLSTSINTYTHSSDNSWSGGQVKQKSTRCRRYDR